MSSVAVDVSSMGDNTLVAAQTGQSVQVFGYLLVAAGSVAAKFKSSGGAALSGAMPMAAQTVITAHETAPAGPVAGRPFHFETAVGEGLVLNLSAGVQVAGHLSYRYVRH